MLETVPLGHLVLGAGAPKLCAPLAGGTLAALLEEAALLVRSSADMAEWRADYFEALAAPEQVLDTAAELRQALAGRPLLFTCRTQAEGGGRAIGWQNYRRLNVAMAQSGQVDALDIELAADETLLAELVGTAGENGVRVVLSRHYLGHTPPVDEMIECLARMHALGADLPKLAVTAQSFADALRLMDAADRYTRACGRPVIALAMGQPGGITRLAGGLYGSAVSFGALRRATAPGQMPVAELAAAMQLLYPPDQAKIP